MACVREHNNDNNDAFFTFLCNKMKGRGIEIENQVIIEYILILIIFFLAHLEFNGNELKLTMTLRMEIK